MANENQIDHGFAAPPEVEAEANRGVAHARKATENLGSAAGAIAREYRGRAERAWDDTLRRVRGFHDDSEKVRQRQSDESGLYRAWCRSRTGNDFPSLAYDAWTDDRIFSVFRKRDSAAIPTLQ